MTKEQKEQMCKSIITDLGDCDKEKVDVIVSSLEVMCKNIRLHLKKEDELYDILIKLPLISFDVTTTIIDGKCYYEKINNFPRDFVTSLNRLIRLIQMNAPKIIMDEELILIAKRMYRAEICYCSEDFLLYMDKKSGNTA